MFTFHPSYNTVAKCLHWIIALAIIAMLVIGWTMTNIENGPAKFALFQWHKSIGITILLLSIFRLIWRLTHKTPPLPSTMPDWEKYAAEIVHFLFYVLIIGIPLTGWILISTSPYPTLFYGLFPWPNLPVLPNLESKKEIGDSFAQIHAVLAYLTVVLLVLHVGAAWKHHLFDHDDVLLRMAPRLLHPLLNKIRGQ